VNPDAADAEGEAGVFGDEGGAPPETAPEEPAEPEWVRPTFRDVSIKELKRCLGLFNIDIKARGLSEKSMMIDACEQAELANKQACTKPGKDHDLEAMRKAGNAAEYDGAAQLIDCFPPPAPAPVEGCQWGTYVLRYAEICCANGSRYGLR